MRQYLLLALTIYIVTLALSCLIYVVLVLVEKRLPIVADYAFSIGEVIFDTVHSLSRPLRCILPNLTEDEYYLMLINAIITAFAFVYAYLFYMIRPEMFLDIPSLQSTAYVHWLDLPRRRFHETRRAG